MAGLIDLTEIAGARATHKFARLSASKVRVVLNLIREEDLGLARDRLRFCERGAAEVVSKVLESAVSNAVNNEQLEAEELYVAECWADEGPVLKRWRPRARGRATRIHKQTSHVTVVVAQLSPEELQMREARLAASGASSPSASRAARVAASRGEAEEAADAEAEADETATEEVTSDASDEVVAAVDSSEATAAAESADESGDTEAAESTADAEASTEASTDDSADASAEAAAETEDTPDEKSKEG